MADYGKFSQSGPFRALLAEFVVENEGIDGRDFAPVLVCQACGDSICDIGEDDTMDVLVQTVIDHDC